MSRVVMVITSEHIDIITSAEGTSNKFNVSQVITVTTRDIFQYLKANRPTMRESVFFLTFVICHVVDNL